MRRFPNAAMGPMVVALVLAAAATAAAGTVEGHLRVRPNDPATTEGFDHFYNMEYDDAIRDFESDWQARPSDAFAANHLILALFFRELNRAHALDPDLYVSDKFVRGSRIEVDAATRNRIRTLIDRALALSTERLDSNPKDVDALYARGVTRGINASYTALIEKSWLAALRSGLGSYKDHKEVLKLSPSYHDAKLVVGMYNYIVGSLPWHIKAAAFLLAITGNKTEGIQDLYEAANAGGDASIDAKTFLGVFLSREHRYAEAMTQTRSLRAAYPRNFLFALGEANLLRRSGQYSEAAASYRQLMESHRQGMYPDAPVELAAFGLGEALRSQRDFAGAAAAYGLVPGYPGADPRLVAAARNALAQMRQPVTDGEKSGQ